MTRFENVTKSEDGHGGAVPLLRWSVFARTAASAGRLTVVVLSMRCDLELAGSWGLLFLVLAAVRLVPLLHGLELLRG
jgi:uncharacterized membrane protein